MKIRTTGLRTGLNEIEEILDPGELGLDGSIFKTPVTVFISAEKSGGKIAISLRTSSPGEFYCDRCGSEFRRIAVGEGEVIFVQREEPFPDESPGDDLRSYGLYQEYIDVSTDVRDALMLALPMKILCDDGCQGLCTKCGANLNLELCRCDP